MGGVVEPAVRAGFDGEVGVCARQVTRGGNNLSMAVVHPAPGTRRGLRQR